ncbi:MAG TPA: hypothetical protein VMY38_07930 [Gemmatimonadaceae bacterium]|nr:hypothetical protein [Gemmatimonadaceae bacterium]
MPAVFVRRSALFAALALLPSVATAQSASLPAARDLIARHVAAIGGRDAVLRHPFFRAKGNLQMPASGLNAEIEVSGAKPNLFVMKMTIPGMGEMLQGFDGTHGWAMDPMQGPRLIEGDELVQLVDEAEFGSVLRESQNIESVETTEKVTLGNEDCYKVRVKRKNGRESFDCYSVASGLLIGAYADQETPMGAVQSVTEFKDYRDFSGVKQPTQIVVSVMNQQQIMTFSSYEYGAMQAGAFAVPAAISTLISQKPKP